MEVYVFPFDFSTIMKIHITPINVDDVAMFGKIPSNYPLIVSLNLEMPNV